MHKNLFLAIYMTVGAIATALGSGSAQAASYGDTSPIYVGVGAGRTFFDAYCYDGECKAHTKGSGKVYAGFNFAPMSAWPGSELTGSLELTGYVGGKAQIGAGTNSGLYKIANSYKGAGLGYRLSLRETEFLSLNARLGVAHVSGKTALDAVELHSVGSTGVTGGLGLSYALNKHWSLNADYDSLRVKFIPYRHTRVHLFTAGAAYKF
jgi:outer membrane immunogenic protein